MARELQDQVRKVIAADEAMHASERQAQSCIEALQSLEVRRSLYEDQLFVREQEIATQLERVSGLEADMGRRAAELAGLQAQLQERESVIAQLRAEIETRDAALNEHASELERSRAASQDSSTAMAELERRLGTHADRSLPPAGRGGGARFTDREGPRRPA